MTGIGRRADPFCFSDRKINFVSDSLYNTLSSNEYDDEKGIVFRPSAPRPVRHGRGPVPGDHGFRCGLALQPRRPEERPVRLLQRPVLAQPRPPARLEHRAGPRRVRTRRGRHRLFPDGDRLVPQAFRRPGIQQGQELLYRVRRGLHEQHRLDQRPRTGDLALRLLQFLLRPDPLPEGLRQRDRRARGQFRAAQLPLVQRLRHLPPREAGGHVQDLLREVGRVQPHAGGPGRKGRHPDRGIRRQ